MAGVIAPDSEEISFGRINIQRARVTKQEPLWSAFWSTCSTWELDTYDNFAKHIKAGDIVVDIGSWVGPTVLYEAQLGARVFGIEPSPKAFKQLRANVDANPRMNLSVTLVNKAMARFAGEVFFTDTASSGDHVVESGSEGVRVPTVTIDDLIRDYPDIGHADFVKIDTEGYEVEIVSLCPVLTLTVPALSDFFKSVKPKLYISLHPMYKPYREIHAVAEELSSIFDALYESDGTTPFNTTKHLANEYKGGDHGGTDILCLWNNLEYIA